MVVPAPPLLSDHNPSVPPGQGVAAAGRQREERKAEEGRDCGRDLQRLTEGWVNLLLIECIQNS